MVIAPGRCRVNLILTHFTSKDDSTSGIERSNLLPLGIFRVNLIDSGRCRINFLAPVMCRVNLYLLMLEVEMTLAPGQRKATSFPLADVATRFPSGSHPPTQITLGCSAGYLIVFDARAPALPRIVIK